MRVGTPKAAPKVSHQAEVIGREASDPKRPSEEALVVTVSIETDTRDRLIVVENEVKHVNEKLDELGVMVRAQHDVFMQAKGARWVIWTAAGVFGFVAGVVGWVVPWLYAR